MRKLKNHPLLHTVNSFPKKFYALSKIKLTHSRFYSMAMATGLASATLSPAILLLISSIFTLVIRIVVVGMLPVPIHILSIVATINNLDELIQSLANMIEHTASFNFHELYYLLNKLNGINLELIIPLRSKLNYLLSITPTNS